MQSSSPDKMMIPTDIPEAIDTCCQMEESRENCCSASFASEFPGTACAEREKSVRRILTSKDEFWDALSSHYDYLMDDGLIATCREASSDLSWDDEDVVTKVYYWSFTQFIEQFKQLHDKLHDLQMAMQDGFRESLVEEQKKVAFSCKDFNEQGQKLSERYPDMRDEVHRHLNLLNNKWNAVEQAVNPKKSQPEKDTALNEITTLMRCLRRWLRELEDRLCPVSLSSKWTVDKLEMKQKEQQVLQKEIEAKGKYVSALLKLCECLDGNVTSGQPSHLRWDAERFCRVSKNLQERWHSIWLQSMECQLIIEDLMRRKKTLSAEKLDLSFSEEPIKKYPRLDGPKVLDDCCPGANAKSSEEDSYFDDDVLRKLNTLSQSCRKVSTFSSATKELKSSTNDKGVMVGNTGIAELKAKCNGNIGKFEIVQDVGYSSETSAHLSNDEQVELSEVNYQSFVADTAEFQSAVSSEVLQSSDHQKLSSRPVSKNITRRLFLTPDKYPSVCLKRYLSLSESFCPEVPPVSKFSKSVPESFYKMTSLDIDGTDDAVDPAVLNEMGAVSKLQHQNASHQTLSVCETDSNEQKQEHLDVVDSCEAPVLPNTKFQSDETCLITEDTSEGHSSEKSKRTARVREWLNNCNSSDDITSDEGSQSCEKHNSFKKSIINNSCDASGEYTTTESDGEKSGVSDDVNNSVTFSQSFTGSVETVVKVVKEESKSHSDRAGSAEPEPSPSVQMRKKKRHTRDRPWSVTELNQIFIQPSRVMHSTSEGALNAMSYSPQNSMKGTPRSKRIRLGFKKSSLTDVSVTSCPLMQVKHLTSQSGSHTSTPQSDRSDGCFSSKEEAVCSKKKSQSSHSSDRHSVSSCNSVWSKTSGHKHKRRLKSSYSESSSKHKSNSDESSASKLVSAELSIKMPAKCNSNPSCPEDHSSVSDQVWDEYQDPPYLSEPYSEQTADEDQVKKLINFGDDYRAVLGSHSDVSSARSTCKIPIRSRARSVQLSNKDAFSLREDLPNSASDSDTEDFHNILATSQRALHFVRNCMKENVPKQAFAFSSEFAELVATCQTNLCPLHAILEELVTKPNFQAFSPGDLQKLRDLIRDWELLQAKLVSLPQQNEQQASADYIQIAVMEVESIMTNHKAKLNAIWNCASDALSAVSSMEQLQENIQALQTGLANLQEMKGAILSVSARILRLMAESGSETVFPLRDAAAKLYQQWEDVYELSSSQLTKLQSLQLRWHESKDCFLEKHLGASEIKNTEIETQKFPVYEQCGNSETTGNIYQKGFPQKSAMNKNFTGAAKPTAKLNESSQDFEELFPLYQSRFGFRSSEEDSAEEQDKVPGSFINTRSRLWRALRASMPIHFALVISYCISCLMEPQCCENVNSLEFSIFPQLRHMQGPPPV